MASKTNLAKSICYGEYRRRARRRGIAFDIPKKEFYSLIILPCTYCGVSLQNANTRRNDTFRYTGLDRIDSSAGYTVGNVQPCCRVCNRLKWDMGEDEFLLHIARVVVRWLLEVDKDVDL